MEGAGSVCNCVDTFNGSIEGTRLDSLKYRSKRKCDKLTYCSDVRDNDNFELVSVGLKEFLDVLRLALRAHGTPYGITFLKEGLNYPDGNKTVGTGDKNFLTRSNGRHCCLLVRGSNSILKENQRRGPSFIP